MMFRSRKHQTEDDVLNEFIHVILCCINHEMKVITRYSGKNAQKLNFLTTDGISP